MEFKVLLKMLFLDMQTLQHSNKFKKKKKQKQEFFYDFIELFYSIQVFDFNPKKIKNYQKNERIFLIICIIAFNNDLIKAGLYFCSFLCLYFEAY